MAPKRSGTECPLQMALQESTVAATTRAAEGQRIFSPIAAFLGQHRSLTFGLPAHGIKLIKLNMHYYDKNN
jgi:hypothetical protein